MAEAFEILGPLPSGVTNIEASAGTGKTFTLAALATRYVAEADISIGEILIVTFTRSAAAELKDRIRQRLVEAEAALKPEAADSSDELLRWLQSEDRVQRHRRIEAALTDFDAATITTIHGFAQQALGSLGLAAPADPDASLVESSDELIQAACSDVLARRALGGSVEIKLNGLVPMVAAVLGLPDIAIIPDGETGVPLADEWVEVVTEIVAHVKQARRSASVMAYDDILTQLRDAISPNSAASSGSPDQVSARVSASMSDRFPVALIDEFQDTDPVQWQIFDTLFADSTLVLVGDPKQAIYAFRGADVHTYVEATSGDGVASSSLNQNWRSDEVLLQVMNVLLRDSSFGEGDIRYVPVRAAEPHLETRITDGSGQPRPAVVIRSVDGRNPSKPPLAGEARSSIATDLASRVRDLLEDAKIPDGQEHRAVTPGDIAVLVRSHSETPGIQQALANHGIPAVMSKVGSVFLSPAAGQLRRLLAGVARPSSDRRVRAVALGWFGAEDAKSLESLDPINELRLAEQLHGWGEVLANRGVDEFAALVWAQSGVAARVLQMPDGDRHLTDLEHLIEVISTTDDSGASISINGLLDRFDVLAEGEKEQPGESLERRIETDATAVQIMTVHGSKGLEWPIVCCPSLGKAVPGTGAPKIVYFDEERGRRVIDVAYAAKWGDEKERQGRAKTEQHAEATRLAYVALTRAKNQVLIWRHQLSYVTPLAQAFFGPGAKPPKNDEFEAQMAVRLAPVIDLVELTRVPASDSAHTDRWNPPIQTEVGDLAVASLGRELPRSSRRWSFTSISSLAAEHSTGHTTIDPEDVTGGDGGGNDEYSGDDAPVEVFVPPVTDLIWGEVPGSAAFGTMVHSAFEEIDFQAVPLEVEVARVVAELGVWNDWPADDQTIVDGITQAVTTPLGPLFDGISLADISHADRLDEMIFDFSLSNSGLASGRHLGELILRHLNPGDQLESWAREIAGGAFDVGLQGHLTGAIDLIVRLGEPGSERYFVVDYKTNSLSEPGMPLMSSDYHPDRLADAMAHHHYPLQALLYSVALHRYLRSRLADYDPARHLGGAGYLFVRGMQGPETPAPDGHPHGVFAWPISPALIVELSDLLDGAFVGDVSP